MYKSFFDMSLDLLCIANSEGYFIEVNPAFSKALGYTEEELKAAPFMEFVHPDDIEKTNKEFEKQSEGVETIKFENRYRHKDGSYRILSWRSSVSADKQQFYAVARDVTAEKTTQYHLEKIYEALYDHAILAVTDKEGKIIEVNEKFCKISQYSKEELIGQDHRIINSNTHSELFFQNMWNTIRSKEIWTGVIQNKAKDGSHYFVHSIIFPLVDALGEITNFMAVRFDMTQHIAIKNNLKKTLEILNETRACPHFPSLIQIKEKTILSTAL